MDSENASRTSGADAAYMAMALRLAERGLGNVWPNPAVGCVLVKDGQIVGRGWTQPGGRPHAEVDALTRAGEAARGATAYVTLEPCSHWGKTPPCADALVAAGVVRVVAALEDRDPRVSGRGFEKLRQAGIEVVVGLCSAQARALNAGFFSVLEEAKPFVAVKTATSLDGKIALANGESRWITGAPARRLVHALRDTFDAVMIGSRTALADDPELTCRLPGLPIRPKVRVVADGRLRLPLTSKLVQTATQSPVWVVTAEGHSSRHLAPYLDAGVEILEAERNALGVLDPVSMLRVLARRGLTRVMVEGGGQLVASLLGADQVDRLIWFHAPITLGGDARPAIAELGLDRLKSARRFVRQSVITVGADLVETYERNKESP